MKLSTIATVGAAVLAFGAFEMHRQAEAGYMTCNSYGSTTSCYGTDGSYINGSTYGGTTTFYGNDSNGDFTSGSCSSYGSTTSCYSY